MIKIVQEIFDRECAKHGIEGWKIKLIPDKNHIGTVDVENKIITMSRAVAYSGNIAHIITTINREVLAINNNNFRVGEISNNRKPQKGYEVYCSGCKNLLFYSYSDKYVPLQTSACCLEVLYCKIARPPDRSEMIKETLIAISKDPENKELQSELDYWLKTK